MSLIGGCSAQPDLVTLSLTSTGAPQRGHVGSPSSLTIRQYGQVYVLDPCTMFMLMPPAELPPVQSVMRVPEARLDVH
jgi:hypothetical protein